MAKENSNRPTFLHGTNDGRVDVPMRGPGEMEMTGPGKGKAQVVNQNLLKLACEGEDKNEGSYNR